MVVHLLLPAGRTRALRALVDTGASDNFLSSQLQQEFGIQLLRFAQPTNILMGTEDSQVDALGETPPLTLQCGPFCTHRTNFTILNLGDYDIILGRPFQKYTKMVIQDDVCTIPTKRGPQTLPRWVSTPDSNHSLIRISRHEMVHALRTEKAREQAVILVQQDAIKLFSLSTSQPEQHLDLGQHKDPNLAARINQQRAEDAAKGSGRGENTGPLSQIPRGSLPGLDQVLKEFADVFPEDLPCELPPDREFNMKIPIKPGCHPTHQAPYRISDKAAEMARQTLEYLYNHKLARDSTSEYAAPITLVPKPDGTWRFCVDYRKLNSITHEAKYPLPRVEDCLDQLKGARYFSKIDLRSGYWQTRIHPDDIHKTAFRTPFGHHEWLVMPFGLQGAPSNFQRMMNHYLRQYLGKSVLCYLDDILIYSRTKEEHLQHLRQVLTILREQKLFAKATKCDFGRTEVQFLGYRVREDQIRKDEEKVRAVRDWPEPDSVREVRRFVGLAGFYRKFIEGFSKIAKPLTDILQTNKFEEKYGIKYTKTAPITLNEEQKKAVANLKEALTTSPCLVIFDPSKPTEVWADASFDNSTVGAVLMQDHGRGLQPVCYLSKVLNDAQSHYPTWEQELLALKIALEKWRHYLLPIHFTCRTDHNGLKYLRTQKNLKERQWHWMAFFSEYQFDLLYRPGKQMQVPDALSRKPKTEEDILDLLRTREGDAEPSMEIKVPTNEGKYQRVLFALHSKTRARAKGLPFPEVSEIPQTFEYKKDPDYGQIYKILKKEPKKLEPSMTLYAIRDGNLVWVDKHLQERICVPVKYRSLLLQEFHDTPLGGHFGKDKTFYGLRQKYIWPSMHHHVEQFVNSCDVCQKNKASHQRRLGTAQLPDLPLEPWERMSIDFCGPFPTSPNGNDSIVGFICNLVRESIILPCKKSITSKGTVKLFIRHVLPRTGLPKVINSDRGPQFVSHFWQNLWKALGTKVALSAPYHPNSNPYVERQNKTLLENLRSFVNARQDDWEKCLPLYEFAYNNSFNASLGDTPFFLSHGRQPTLPISVSRPTKSPAVNDFVQNLHNRIMAARDHLKLIQGIAADRRQQHLRPTTFSVGDLVLLNTENYNLQLPSHKLSPRWIGPLKVLQIRGPNTVLIEVPPRLSRIEPIQNVEHLKRYVSRHSSIGPTQPIQFPDIIDGQEEYEVEDILAHRKSGTKTEYLVRFKNYGPEDDLWLPQRNLVNAPDILQDYHDRQRDKPATSASTSQRAPRHLVRLGHLWLSRDCQQFRREECDRVSHTDPGNRQIP